VNILKTGVDPCDQFHEVGHGIPRLDHLRVQAGTTTSLPIFITVTLFSYFPCFKIVSTFFSCTL
jgi:hypothetical protein